MKRAYVMWEGRCYEFTAETKAAAREKAIAWLFRKGAWSEVGGNPPDRTSTVGWGQ